MLALLVVGLAAPRVGRGHRVDQGVEVVGLGHRQGLELGHDPAGQAAQHAARAHLDEGACPQPGHRLEGLAPADRTAQLGREQAGPFSRVAVGAGVDVGHHRDLGSHERGVADGLAQGRAGRRHERGVKGARDRDGQDLSGTHLPGDDGHGGHGVGGPGDDHLSRRVVVRHPDVAFGPLAGGRRVVVGDPEQGGHRPGMVLAGPGHGLAPGDDESEPVFEGHGTAGHQAGVLAQAVPGAGRRREAEALDGVEHDQALGEGRQLGVGRRGQLLHGRLDEEVGQVEPGGVTGFADDLPRGVVDPRPSHARPL